MPSELAAGVPSPRGSTVERPMPRPSMFRMTWAMSPTVAPARTALHETEFSIIVRISSAGATAVVWEGPDRGRAGGPGRRAWLR